MSTFLYHCFDFLGISEIQEERQCGYRKVDWHQLKHFVLSLLPYLLHFLDDLSFFLTVRNIHQYFLIYLPAHNPVRLKVLHEV